MKLYIKYMVSNRCKTAVKEELRRHGLHFVLVDLGEVDIMEELTKEQHDHLKSDLLKLGFELMEDKKGILIEKIKTAIIEMIHHTGEPSKVKFSEFLSEKLNHDYTYMANLFTVIHGTTIGQFIGAHKIERIKELMVYSEFSITEIAWQMNYSSVAHLSNQFKKATGFTPSYYREKIRKRTPIEEVGHSNGTQ